MVNMSNLPAYKTVPTDSLIPYARNSRTHSDEQVGQIAASIKEFGFLNPIIIDGENGIIAGHGRVLAAQKLGMDTLPVIEAAHLTETQRKAYIIADNKLALTAGWDDEMLRVELDEIGEAGFDLTVTGFSLDEIEMLTVGPMFEPGTEDDQGKLDELAPKWVECPHYSGTTPANKSARIGVWEKGSFKGVIIFGLGASPSLGTKYGLAGTEVCELTRVALRSHDAPVSRAVAIALRMLKRQSPALRLVVSFADTWHGHHGGIYQAGGWVYSGLTSPAKMIKLPSGKMADPRRFNGHGHNKAKPIPAGATEVRTPPKHRYLMPLDSEMRERIAPLAKPYPKREKQATSGHHPESGGAAPTLTLQTNEAKNARSSA